MLLIQRYLCCLVGEQHGLRRVIGGRSERDERNYFLPVRWLATRKKTERDALRFCCWR